jgi:tetratricopeptide (TPR) repeat protein
VPTAPTYTAPIAAAALAASHEHGALGRGTVFGRYVLLESIGEGGMGQVFAAHDAALDRNVALKIVKQAPERVAQAWLVREAKAMARVQHPAIVTVHDIGSVGARVYIAMELVRGTTLRGWLERERRSWRDIVRMYAAAGRGLEAAHAAGITHRDFKPDNVLVDVAGGVRVSDFGIAELRGAEAGMPASAGTPSFMAPEQFTGRGCDARSDQFSFCVAIWQAVYGEHPFAQHEADLRRAVTAGQVRTPPDRAPRWLEAALRRGLAVDPAARHPSMTALLATLDRGLARRRRRLVVPAALVLAGAAVAAPLALASRHAASPTCASAGERIATVWDATRRAQVSRALGPALPAHLLDAIDAYARGWGEQRVEACRATHERGEQSGELLDLRMQCLDRRLDELGALLDVLVAGEPGVAGKAESAVDALVPLSACADVQSLRDVVPLPAAPEARARVAALREQSSKVKADLDTGRFAHGFVAVQPLVRLADTIGYDPLIAELELLHGVLAWRSDHMDVAEAALERALARAEAGRDGATSAEAWLDLVNFTSQERKRPAEALRLGAIAQGAIDRYSGNPGLTSALAEQLGWIALDQGRLDDAERYAQRAYDIRRPSAGENSQPTAASLEHLALVATARKDHVRALDLHRRALAIFERVEGRDHPDTLTELNDYGAALFEAGKLDEALAVYRDGLARVERTLGPDGMDAALYVHNIGLVDTALGKHAEALAMQQRALAIHERVRGPDAPDTIELRGDVERAQRAVRKP